MVWKTLVANGLSKFSIKGKPVFSNDERSLPRNPSDCMILDNWVFDKFTLADPLFTKALRRFETYLLVSKNLCGKLVPSFSWSTIFDEHHSSFIFSYWF